jgi:hypothetical protein
MRQWFSPPPDGIRHQHQQEKTSVQSTKTLPALDIEQAVRRSRQIERLIDGLAYERKGIDATIIMAVGAGNAIEVDGTVTRVKQATTTVLPLEALVAAREAGEVSRGMFNNLTTRVVDNGLVKRLRELGRLRPAVADLLVDKQAAAYVDHV